MMDILYKLRWACTAAVSIAILVLSTIPVPEVPELEDVPFIDKWVHFVMYGALSLAMWLDRAAIRREGMSAAMWVMLLVYPALYGGLMELVQAYCTTYRSGDWLDFYADAFGALVGLAVCSLIHTPLKRKL